MKTHIIIQIAFISLCFFGVACNSAGPDAGNEPELLGLQFTRSAYSADHALILRATPNPELSSEFLQNNPVTVQLSSTGGAAGSAQFSPWSHLSDEEMVAAINDGPGRVAVRIKETDQASARNSQGELIRSEEAMNRFIDWVENHEAFTVSWISQSFPDLGIEFLDTPNVNIVYEIRSHENVEFIEPVQYGEYLSTTTGGTVMGESIVSMILPGEWFVYLPGDTITAGVQQADGTVLKASAVIAE